MPRKSLVHQAKVDRAISLLIRAPTLTVREAMLAAEFTKHEANTKYIQRKVARCLPGKTKGSIEDNSKDTQPLSNIDINSGCSESSPLTDPSGMMPIRNENFSPSPPRKLKKQRLTSQQLQDKREYNLDQKRPAIKAHKAATLLYNKERGKSGGMSVREVKQAIKLKHKGFGPSRSTIQHYVVNLGLIGMSPRKPGPGNIPAVMYKYKSLCAAFGSCMRINQINALGGDNSGSKMIPLIAVMMNFSISAATDLIRHLC
jgi:hypothetical protein